MVALLIYTILTTLGLALGIEVAVRGGNEYFGTGAAIYSILTLLVAMFFGGWATSRLAVGESKTEAILYGMILWGVLFIGMIWLFSAGIRTGFSAMVGMSSGTYAGSRDVDRVLDSPSSLPSVANDVANRPEVRQAVTQSAEGARIAAWWTLVGVLTSMATVILGSLIGSGELLQPVPVLGVRRTRVPQP